MSSEVGSGRRDEIVDAAIHVLGTSGSRNLTHRAVDRYLGIAEGSSSNYFRTRHTLLAAIFARIADVDMELLHSAIENAATQPPGRLSIQRVFEAALMHYVFDDSRLFRQRARLEILLISADWPELNETVREYRMKFRDSLMELAKSLQSPLQNHAVRFLVDFGDGILLDRIVSSSFEPIDLDHMKRTFSALLDTIFESQEKV